MLSKEVIIALGKRADPEFTGKDEGDMQDSIVGIDAVMAFARVVAAYQTNAIQGKVAIAMLGADLELTKRVLKVIKGSITND